MMQDVNMINMFC